VITINRIKHWFLRQRVLTATTFLLLRIRLIITD